MLITLVQGRASNLTQGTVLTALSAAHRAALEAVVQACPDDGLAQLEAAVEAVAEVGNPTVVATLTVVAALLPMLFVSGLMGPYMAPIPVNASAAMIFSFFVAVVIVPWLMIRFARKTLAHGGPDHAHEEGGGKQGRLVAAPRARHRRAIVRGAEPLRRA